MARKTRHRRGRQRGGGWGFAGTAFAPAGGMAPEASRTMMDDCATTVRQSPSVSPTGAWSQAGGGCGCGSVLAPKQQGGGFWSSLFGGSDASGSEAADMNGVPMGDMSVSSQIDSDASDVVPSQQMGGGGGGGGYGFSLDNTLGKVYSATPVGPCPQKGGGADALVSYPAGYGYAQASAMEVGNGSAHFLAQIPYGRQCMGGGARRATRRIGDRRTQRKRGVRRATRRIGDRRTLHRSARKGRRQH